MIERLDYLSEYFVDMFNFVLSGKVG